MRNSQNDVGDAARSTCPGARGSPRPPSRRGRRSSRRGRGRGRRARSAGRSRSSTRSRGTRRAGRRGPRAAPSRAPRPRSSAASRRDAEPFSGRDRAVGGEHAQERHPRPAAARDGVVVVADAVVHGPGREREHRRRAAGRRPGQPAPPGDRGREQRRERGGSRTWFAGRISTSAARPGPSATKPRSRRPLAASSRGAAPRPRDRWRRPRRSRPGGRASRRRDRRGGGARSTSAGTRPKVSAVALHATTEPAKSTPKTTSRRTAPAEIHRQPDDERRERRAEELDLGERRVGVEELEVVGEVVPGVPALGHRPAERLDQKTASASAKRTSAALRVGTNASSRCQARLTSAGFRRGADRAAGPRSSCRGALQLVDPRAEREAEVRLPERRVLGREERRVLDRGAAERERVRGRRLRAEAERGAARRGAACRSRTCRPRARARAPRRRRRAARRSPSSRPAR